MLEWNGGSKYDWSTKATKFELNGLNQCQDVCNNPRNPRIPDGVHHGDGHMSHVTHMSWQCDDYLSHIGYDYRLDNGTEFELFRTTQRNAHDGTVWTYVQEWASNDNIKKHVKMIGRQCVEDFFNPFDDIAALCQTVNFLGNIDYYDRLRN